MPEGKQGLISVVIPTRNRCALLEQAVSSVRNQTWKNIEIIVVDDASNDGTQSYLRKLASAEDGIRVIRNEVPCGGSGARNQGIEAATGGFIAFLDDDDVWMPTKLEEQFAMMAANSGASSVSCGFFIEYPFGIRRNVHVSPSRDEQQILRVNHLGGASMCFTAKKVLAAVKGFDPNLSSGQDWDLWIKLCGEGNVLVCEKPLVRYRPDQGVRITSNLKSTYDGRRKLYFRYKARMSGSTRKYLLCELMYCRKVLLRSDRLSSLLGFLQVLQFVDGMRMFRYVYRYLKFNILN
jgi:glycosyltransferase involved in cell wall biosynthesis